MRWFVEVSSIGKTEKHSYCLEADSWQRALQATRALRNDNGPMTGFSIELLDEGFSAVDPMSRLRYFVRRAADDAPLTADKGAPKATPPRDPPELVAETAGTPTVPTAVKTSPAPPRPASAAVSAAPQDMKKERSKTFVFGSSGAAVVAPVPAPAVVLPPPEKPTPDATPPPTRMPTASSSVRSPTGPRPPSAPGAPPPAPPGAAVAAAPVARAVLTPETVPGVELLFKREQEPDNRTPLHYREYVYAVPRGTSELIAKALLMAQFELVKETLLETGPGKLVNLAIFDVAFKGKPPVPPLVTLTWKDWKGGPIVELPQHRNGPGPRPASTPPPPAVDGASYVTAGVTAGPAGGAPPPVTQPRPAPAAALLQPPPVAVAPSVIIAVDPPAAPPPSVIVAPQPVPPSVILAPPPARHVPSPHYAPPIQPQAPALAFPTPGAALGVNPALTPSRGVRRATGAPGALVRLRGDELIADLFEAMHDLHFLRDAIEGADFCLTLALEKMPSQAGLVHLYDIDKREFVVTCARGPGAEQLLLHRHPEGEPLLKAAMRKQRATVVVDATKDGAGNADRYRALGGAKSLVVAPVMLAGRFLGAIELVNPVDGAPFTDNEGHALSYIGEQFAEFVSTRGVLLDPERIVAATAAPPLRR